MRPFSPKSTLKYIALWNAFRAVWMTFFVILDLRSLAALGYKGPYFGIGLDARFLLTIAVMPFKLLGVVAGFYFGRVGDMTVEIVAALTYASVALGIWRRSSKMRHFAVALNVFEALLLVLSLTYAVASPLLPELHLPFILYFTSFAVVHSSVTIWLLQGRVKDSFAPGATSAIGS
jgi:hypothetical protein